MIITKMHWLFKERYNRSATNFYPDFSPIQIDQYINDAVEILVQEYGGQEDNRILYDMLSPLLVSTTLTGSNGFFSLSGLTQPYFRLKRVTANTECGPVKVTMEGHGRIDDLLGDAFQQPSVRWGRILGTFQSDGLKIYAEHTISSLSLEYFRVPKPAFFGGYDSFEYLDCIKTVGRNCTAFNSKVSPSQDCEIHPNYHARVVDVAVREAQRTLGQQEIALTQNKIDSILNTN